jgi:hypothetical protein
MSIEDNNDLEEEKFHDMEKEESTQTTTKVETSTSKQLMQIMMSIEDNNDLEEEKIHDMAKEESTQTTTKVETSTPKILMQISLQVVLGNNNDNTLTLSVCIAGRKAIALVDAGSTLMHPKYMHDLCCSLMHIPTYYNVIRCYNHVL